MSCRASGFEFEDHAADVRVRAWGSSLQETMAAATTAVWQCVYGDEALPLTRSWEVSAEGADLEEVLVNFLNEQIYLYDSSGLVPASQTETCIREDRGKISVRALFHGCLAAEVKGAPQKYLKAATYHRISVTPNLIEITLDV
jgi:SHS2 domain-containing protein